MNSPIDNLLLRIERLMTNDLLNPDKRLFLENMQNLLKNYRIDPGKFSDFLLCIHDFESLEKDIKK
jgi:hypothetical protein